MFIYVYTQTRYTNTTLIPRTSPKYARPPLSNLTSNLKLGNTNDSYYL